MRCSRGRTLGARFHVLKRSVGQSDIAALAGVVREVAPGERQVRDHLPIQVAQALDLGRIEAARIAAGPVQQTPKRLPALPACQNEIVDARHHEPRCLTLLPASVAQARARGEPLRMRWT